MKGVEDKQDQGWIRDVKKHKTHLMERIAKLEFETLPQFGYKNPPRSLYGVEIFRLNLGLVLVFLLIGLHQNLFCTPAFSLIKFSFNFNCLFTFYCLLFFILLIYILFSVYY